MSKHQSGILYPIPHVARYLFFDIRPGVELAPTVKSLAARVDGEQIVAGLGPSLISALGGDVPGLRTFPCYTGPGIDVPSTPAAVWCWLRGDERGELVHRTRELCHALSPALRLNQCIDAFTYRGGRDLSGYEDGTENPKDDEAIEAALVPAENAKLAGSSFVAVQQWVHDLDRLEAIAPEQRDLIIGRRLADNSEIDDAPLFAHVKRTAQESFEPEAFVVRRSMPWADEHEAGFFFVAFGKSLDAFEAQLQRMAGVDDGIVDGLFEFTRPVSGAYFWCPPMGGGGLDLSLLDL